MTANDYKHSIPPFSLNTERYGRCTDCKEIDILHDGLCDECTHKRRMQNVINAIKTLGKDGTPEEIRMKLDAIYESALPLARE